VEDQAIHAIFARSPRAPGHQAILPHWMRGVRGWLRQGDPPAQTREPPGNTGQQRNAFLGRIQAKLRAVATPSWMIRKRAQAERPGPGCFDRTA